MTCQLLCSIFAVVSCISKASSIASNYDDVTCVGPQTCLDRTTSKTFQCVGCCPDTNGEIRLQDAPRGTQCCDGFGVFDFQTHTCGDAGIEMREETAKCPNSDVNYNTQTQTCCRSLEGDTVAHLLQDDYKCCGTSYISNSTGCCSETGYDIQTQCCKYGETVTPKEECRPANSAPSFDDVTCFRSSGCLDKRTRKTFTCIKEGFECCTDARGKLELHHAPRGTACCPGYGMFNIQTQTCGRAGIEMLEEAELCPGSDSVYHNTRTQICCPDPEGEPVVHLLQDSYRCCGKSYINNSTGCCNGTSYDVQSQCCKDGENVVSKEECSSTKSIRKCRKRACTRSEMERRFRRQRKQASYTYFFRIRNQFRADETHTYYKVDLAKRFKGVGDGDKTKTVKSNLRDIAIPKCSCPEILEPGANYIVMTKTRAHRRQLVLRERKFAVLPVEASEVLAKIFDS